MEKRNISELLSTHKFVVPEIQRDYVWGLNPIVLSQFIKDIDDRINQGVNIGFLYSYSSNSENLDFEQYLIDGQQRYTTIILLLYFLSVKDDTLYKDFLKRMRVYELIPSFDYRTRSETSSFLHKLFISGLIKGDEIRQQKWYKSLYDKDLSINSILGTLKEFEKVNLGNTTYNKILYNIWFWYFNVSQTSQGEELYITMNSRGEDLTDSEQIKPRLFNLISDYKEKFEFGKKWDDWEEFLYSKRAGKPVNSIDVALNNIVRITLEMKDLREHRVLKPILDSEIITIYDIEKTMESIENLFNIDSEEIQHEIMRLYGGSKSDADFIVLKSLIAHARKKDPDMREYIRVYHVMRNQIRRGKIKSHLDALSFLDQYQKYDSSFYNYLTESGQTLVNGHELDKIRIYLSYGRRAEDSLWKAQAEKFWDGDIKVLLEWSTIGNQFSVERFENIVAKFNRFYCESQEKGWTNNDVRRALLTFELTNYPIHRNNDWNFGYTSYDWKEIFNTNLDLVYNFINNIGELSVKEYCENFITNFDRDKDWSEFVKEKYLLDYLNTYHITHDARFGFMLVQNSWARAISVKNMHLYHLLFDNLIKKESINRDIWNIGYWTGWNSSVHLDNKAKNYIFVFRYNQENGTKFKIGLYIPGSTKEAIYTSLKWLAEKEKMEFDDDWGGYTKEIEFSDEGIINFVKRVIEQG